MKEHNTSNLGSSACGSCCDHDGHSHGHGEARPLLSRLSLPACALGAVLGAVTARHSQPAATAIYAVAVLCGGWELLARAARAIPKGRFDMNVLMTVATLGACALGDWGEATMLLLLYGVAELLEEASVRRSRGAITQLLKLAPDETPVLCDGVVTLKNTNEVQPGEVFLVRAGDRVMLDGVVLRGTSEVNQAQVTGESMPVLKRVGDELYAGSQNGSGALEVTATHGAADSTVARIVRLVAEAEERKSGRQTTVERFAARYTPIVLIVALLAAVLQPYVVGVPLSVSIYRALALLVAGCPCALVLSGPIAAACALGAAARQGILIRGGAVLEDLAGVRTIAFDKTGTLTLGRPQVVDFVSLNGTSREDLIGLAADLERHSTHPLARAVVAYAGEGRGHAEFENVKESDGEGIAGEHGDHTLRLAPAGWFVERNLLGEGSNETVEGMRRDGHSVSVFGCHHGPIAAVSFSDTVRPEAREALKALRTRGINRQIVLSGDHAASVLEVASQVGADSWQSNLLPGEKSNAIAELTGGKGLVAMVGDGINDAPALARADIGIAIGTGASAAAVEAADIAILGDDLSKLPQAIDIARRARGVINQNIMLAMGMKLVFVVGLFLNVWGGYGLIGGVVADMGATVLVTLNGLRLAR